MTNRISFWLSLVVVYMMCGILGYVGITGLSALILAIGCGVWFHRRNCNKIEKEEK